MTESSSILTSARQWIEDMFTEPKNVNREELKSLLSQFLDKIEGDLQNLHSVPASPSPAAPVTGGN